MLLYALHYTHSLFFFFNDTATTEIYTLSLHDALPIFNMGTGQAAINTTLTALESRGLPGSSTPSSVDTAVANSRFNGARTDRSEEHTSELQSPCNLVCRLLLEKKNEQTIAIQLLPHMN